MSIHSDNFERTPQAEAGAVLRVLLSLTKGLVEAPQVVEKAGLALAWHRLTQSAGRLTAIAMTTLIVVLPKGESWNAEVMGEGEKMIFGIDAMVDLAEWPSEEVLVCVQLALRLLQLQHFPGSLLVKSRLR